MKKFLRGLWLIVEFIIIVYVIVLTSFLLCKNKYGYTQFGDYTFTNINLIEEKNISNTKNGDLLVVKNSNDIKEGDVIYYYAVYNDGYIVKSAPVSKIKNDDYSYLYTVDDSGPTSIVGTRVLGKYGNTYSGLGSILNILESRLGFLFLVLLPILIVFIYQVYEFIVIIKYERVEADDEEEDEQVEENVKEEDNKEVVPTQEEVKEESKDVVTKDDEVVKEEVKEEKPEDDAEVL